MGNFYLNWDETGKRTYHTGVDRGVIYVADDSPSAASPWKPGVAWSGLRTVSESPDGAEEQAFYADNIKYLSLRGVENFGGSIGCYDTPEEFDACDGTRLLVPTSGQQAAVAGVYLTQQNRLPFCFTYRTRKGNDAKGDDFGYLIHIVYNATASPSSREFQSVNESPSPIELSYEFKTTPIDVGSSGFRPTSRIIIDSTVILSSKLTLIENYLYGTVDSTTGEKATDGKILLPDKLIEILTQ